MPSGGDGTFLTDAQDTSTTVQTAVQIPNMSLVRSADAEELSERRMELVRNAHMRAEHQAQARMTMLDLANALDKASLRRRELEARILEEQGVAVGLREELTTWPPKVEHVKNKWEDLRLKVVDWGIKASAREGAAFPLLLTLALEWRPIGERRSVTGKPLSDEESMKVDRLLLKEMLKSWYAQVSEKGPARKVSEIKVAENPLTAELEAMARLLEEEREKNKALQGQIDAKDAEVKSILRRILQLEDEKVALLKQAEKAREVLVVEKQVLRDELDKVPDLLRQKDQENELIRKALAELQEEILRVKAQAEADRLALIERIQLLAAELENALTSAKHMKETAVKAKREQTGCISPEKFAQLIIELEELRDQMNLIGTEKDNEKELIHSLKQQLSRNRRRWELERQFLPLLHQVKGPVGPPSRGVAKKEALWATQSAVVTQAPPEILGQVPSDRMKPCRSSGDVRKIQASTNGFRAARNLM